jgi:AcrR family transcriptional regulator
MVEAARRRAGRPTQRDAIAKSETVLEVATDLFVTRGYNGTTMEAVAQAADIGKQALYQRYPDKDNLFAAVIERLKDDEVFQHLPPAGDLPAEEGLRTHIRTIFSDCAQPKSLLVCKLVMREGHRFPALVALIAEASRERFIEPLADYLKSRIAAGDMRTADPLAAAMMCTDLIFAEITRTMFRDALLSPEEVRAAADRVADLVFQGLRAEGR